MTVYCDLHIHTCLSPCASDEMTPWNIVGMAKVKGLALIAITDHNCALNLPQAMLAGAACGVAVVPGIEITSREDVHMLAYFPVLEAALAFGADITRRLPEILNRRDLFGNQLIVGDGDEPTGQVEKLLLGATDMTADELCAKTAAHGGACVPAHINRGANGMMGALGLMPPLPQYPIVEVSTHAPCAAYALAGRTVLHSSDAHRLEDIAERNFSLMLAEATPQALVDWLRHGGNP
jgi:hypothetical protein